MEISILLTCRNRKEMTRKCIGELIKQLNEQESCLFDIYVYDDGSTDGTYEMLRNEFQGLIVLRGDGTAYWCKSMYCLMDLAVKKKYDFYLMVNDDVQFKNQALNIVLNSYKMAGGICGIVGATSSVKTGEATYGGHSYDTTIISPNGKLQQCYWANWNCFLIDSEVLNRVGLIDGKYQHSWGDFDYSHRMKKRGIPVYLATDFVGECEVNSHKGTYKDNGISRCERLKKLFSPKGLPFYSYFRYNIRTEGVRGTFKAIYGYMSILAYIIFNKKID